VRRYLRRPSYHGNPAERDAATRSNNKRSGGQIPIPKTSSQFSIPLPLWPN
jgi:hypothetical protein